MATDPLREAIEREVLLYCSCPGTCCCAATVNDVYAAVSPLLAAERERREAAERALKHLRDLMVMATAEVEAAREELEAGMREAAALAASEPKP